MAEKTFKHPPFIIMLGLLIGGFVGLYGESALNIALSHFMTDFSLEATTAQWLTTGYLLVVGVVLPTSSLLVRWFTTRQLAFFSFMCFLVGALLSGTASTFSILMAGRLIQGIATGILLPLLFSTALAIYPQEKRGAAMGMIGLVVMFAPALGPTLAGFILEYLSWNWIFFLMIPVVLAAAVVSFFFLENVQDITRPPVDVASIVLSTLGFGLLVFGVSEGGERGWGSIPVLASLILGIASLAVFCRRQFSLDEPFLDVQCFRSKEFSRGAALVALDNAILMAAVLVIPLFLQKSLLIPTVLAGLLMLPGGIVNGLVSTVAGNLFDKRGARMVVRTGFIASLVAALLLMQVSVETSLLLVVVGHIILMVGAPLAMSPSQTYALNALPSTLNSDGTTILSTLQQIAGALGTALVTSAMSWGESASVQAGITAETANIATGSQYGFALVALIAALGLIASFGLKKKSECQGADVSAEA